MLRTLGFFSGVGLAIAGFLLVLEPADILRLRAATSTALAQVLPQKNNSAGSPVARLHSLLRTRDGQPSPAAQTAPQPDPVTASHASRGYAEQSDASATPATPQIGPPNTTSKTPLPELAPATPRLEPRSHLFWSPFRSEPAAQGFAGRLSAATDVAVTVTKASPASYRVGFAYRDETERRALIERIESLTGLELE